MFWEGQIPTEQGWVGRRGKGHLVPNDTLWELLVQLTVKRLAGSIPLLPSSNAEIIATDPQSQDTKDFLYACNLTV